MVLPAGQLSSLDFGSYEEMKKQRWTCIDILKCLAALAVVEIHKPLEGAKRSGTFDSVSVCSAGVSL